MRGYVEALEAAQKFGYSALTETEQALIRPLSYGGDVDRPELSTEEIVEEE